MVWDFTPEQLQDPCKVIEYLKGKCCAYSREAQLTTLCCTLASIYQTLLNFVQHPQEKERETKPTGSMATATPATDTAAIPTPVAGNVVTPTLVTGTAAEPENQPVPVSVAPIQKKKYTKKSVRLVRDDDDPGSAREQEEEEEPEIITRSLSLSKLQDMRKDFSQLPGENIVTWLLRCWDNGASSLELEGRGTRQLGSLSREGGTDKSIGKKTQALSLWRRLLSGVRERYPFSEDVVGHPSKWTTMERDPDEIQCTRSVWRKFVRSAPSSYANSLAVMEWKGKEGPTVDEVAARLRQYEKSRLISAVEKLSWKVQQPEEDMSFSPPVGDRDNRTVWIRWRGTSDPQEYKALVDTGTQCTLVPSSYRGAECIYISGVTGRSQELTALEAEVSLTGNEWQKHPIVTGPEAPGILGIDYLRRRCFKDSKGYRWAFGIAALETEEVKQLSALPGLSEDPSVVGMLRVEEQQIQGVISKTRSPFNSPIWPVRKSNGEWRLTVDYHDLNEVTPPLSAAVPDMLELQYELESKAAKWYATTDIANAFFSNCRAAECRPQFAFTWRGVQYTWNRLPQGWKHSPTICHGLIQTALEQGEAPEHLQYIDDIIVWGNTAEEVFEKGNKIVQILLKAGFAINRSKVKGPAQEIQFLGIKWQDGRRQIPMDVISKIAAMSPPTSKKETQAFLGIVGFWRTHSPDYSLIVSPLYKVTRKKNDFKWGPEQRQAFEQIKQEIVHAVALGPVRAGQDVKNVLFAAAGENGPYLEPLAESARGDSRSTPRVLESGIQRI
ncbi:hypothetical protein llap_16188 [Limosa lapponica baueri]|uniref:ribonuclease H n=1 Tax=Limosa lapponica baueri TaxID=1758121 RepID=A0A2I0TI59_LIMLA|nr:hypothetical protein llap_16188 [Limosa lapponica baueri]